MMIRRWYDDNINLISGDAEGPVLPVKHRRDQDPRAFGK